MLPRAISIRETPPIALKTCSPIKRWGITSTFVLILLTYPWFIPWAAVFAADV
jgi:hypothetical protein